MIIIMIVIIIIIIIIIITVEEIGPTACFLFVPIGNGRASARNPCYAGVTKL